MASKRRIRRKSCEGKIQYDTKELAAKALYKMIKSNKVTLGNLNVYHCKFCNQYHWGHKSFRKERR